LHHNIREALTYKNITVIETDNINKNLGAKMVSAQHDTVTAESTTVIGMRILHADNFSSI
jgi:hypothetical protein